MLFFFHTLPQMRNSYVLQVCSFFQPNDLTCRCHKSLLQLAHQPWPSFSSICFLVHSPSCWQWPQKYSAAYQICSWIPQPLLPVKKCANINLLQALHVLRLFLLNLISYWFLSHFLPAGESEAVFWLVLVVVPQPWLCFPANGVTPAALWLAAGEVYALDLIMRLDCWFEETSELSVQLRWSEMDELLRQHWLQGHTVNTPLIIITKGGERMTTEIKADGRLFRGQNCRNKISFCLDWIFFFFASFQFQINVGCCFRLLLFKQCWLVWLKAVASRAFHT